MRPSVPKRLSLARRGFTLLETCAALAITSILVVSIGVAMLLAGQSLPDSAAPAQTAYHAGVQCERILGEIRYATYVHTTEPNYIRFTVPDRNGDGDPDTIIFTWDSVPGGRLSRHSSTGPGQLLLANVHQFRLEYDYQDISEEVPNDSQGEETLLVGHVPDEHIEDYAVKDDRYCGQYFRPLLPGDAVSWEVTRIKLRARSSGLQTGLTKIQLCRATQGGLPTIVVLEEHDMSEALLPLWYEWQELHFSGATGLSPDAALCLVVRHVSGAESCAIQYQDENFSSSHKRFIESRDRGKTWSAVSGACMAFRVYGRITTSGEPSEQHTFYLRQARLTLQVGPSPASTIHAGVSLPNRPEVKFP